MSETLNRMLGQRWQSFAGQPYFDKNGIFISAVLSAPLVADMMIILVGSAWTQQPLSKCLFCYDVLCNLSVAQASFAAGVVPS